VDIEAAGRSGVLSVEGEAASAGVQFEGAELQSIDLSDKSVQPITALCAPGYGFTL
jgi:hypothetical protein